MSAPVESCGVATCALPAGHAGCHYFAERRKAQVPADLYEPCCAAEAELQRLRELVRRAVDTLRCDRCGALSRSVGSLLDRDGVLRECDCLSCKTCRELRAAGGGK